MKRAIALILAVVMALVALMPVPAFSGVHPCEAKFAVKVEGKLSYVGIELVPVEFYEPEYGFCKTFTVEVWILGVQDMFAYEFVLHWNRPEYIVLVDYSVNTNYWADSFVLQPDSAYRLRVDKKDPTLTWYKQVASAVAPSVGFSGNALLATLTFHIYNDICWTWDYWPYMEIDFWIDVDVSQVSNSCGIPLSLCDPLNGIVNWYPVQPDIKTEPNLEIRWVVGEKFTKTVYVSNITKMKSLHFNLSWYNWYSGAWHPYDPDYKTIFPQVRLHDYTFLVKGPFEVRKVTTGINPDNYLQWIYVDIEWKCTAPLLNGTFPVIEFLFEILDPWDCGRQPMYYFEQPHVWDTVPCISDFWFEEGYFDVYCPDYREIWFGQCFGDTTDIPERAIYWTKEEGIIPYRYTGQQWFVNSFIFYPIPGDLDLSGHVDILDLLIIAGAYGKDVHVYPYMYYDLDGDDDIDIFDIVIVAKNFCRTSP